MASETFYCETNVFFCVSDCLHISSFICKAIVVEGVMFFEGIDILEHSKRKIASM